MEADATMPATRRGLPPDPLDGWRLRLAGEPAGSPLASLLEPLLAELKGGADPAEVDRCLERDLRERSDPELRDRIGAEVDRELSGFASRMSPQTLDETRRRAIVSRLRSALGPGSPGAGR